MGKSKKLRFFKGQEQKKYQLIISVKKKKKKLDELIDFQE